MKKVLIVLVLIVAVGVSLPYGMGYLGERQIRNIATQLSERPQFDVSVENYKRGWFSATAVMMVNYKALKHEFDKKQIYPKIDQASFTLKQNIKHGPFLWTSKGLRIGMAYSDSDVMLSPGTEAALNEIFKNQTKKPEIFVDSMIHVNGSSEHHFRVPEFSYRDGDDLITTTGVDGSWSMSSDLKYHTGVLNFGELYAKDKNGTLRMHAPEVVFEMKHNDIGLFTGKGRIKFPSFELSQNGKTFFQLKKLDVTSETSVYNDLFKFTWDGDLDKVVINNLQYGPCLLKTSLENLDAKVLVKMQELLDVMQDPQTPKDKQQDLLYKFIAQVPFVFNKGAELHIDPLEIRMPQGRLKVTGHARLEPSKDNNVPTNPFAIMQRLSGKLNVIVPKSVAQELVLSESYARLIRMERTNELRARQQREYSQLANNQQQPEPYKKLTPAELIKKANEMAESYMQSLLKNGYVEVDGDSYTMKAVMKDGVLTVNGKRLSNQLLGMIF